MTMSRDNNLSLDDDKRNPYTKEAFFQGLAKNPVRLADKITILLRLVNVRWSCIDFLTQSENIVLFQQAFTHSSKHSEKNYEWLELMGDATMNKCVLWYINKAFPFLRNPKGVKIIARLKINLISKKNFADLSMRLGFPEYVCIDESQSAYPLFFQNPTCCRSICEDVLEAFFGCLEFLLDEKYGSGIGLIVCYRLFHLVMKTVPISLRYEELYDSVTRLKETFDYFHNKIGKMIFSSERENLRHHVEVKSSLLPNEVLGAGVATSLDEAKAIASEKALLYLKTRFDIYKPIPEYYHHIHQIYLRTVPLSK